MTPDEAASRVQEQNRSLASKKILLLTVELETEEQADEIFQWMYGKEPPMRSKLVGVAWDKVAIPKAQAEALRILLDTR